MAGFSADKDQSKQPYDPHTNTQKQSTGHAPSTYARLQQPPQRKRLNPIHPFAGLQQQKKRTRNPFLSVVQRERATSTVPSWSTSGERTGVSVTHAKNAPAGVSTDPIPHPENDTENETTLESDDNESECSESTDDGDGFLDMTTREIIGSHSNAREEEQEENDVYADDDDYVVHDDAQYLELTISLLRKLQRRQVRFVSWESLLSTVSFAGRKNMTATQYSYLRSAVLAANSHLCIRTYKTCLLYTSPSPRDA